MDRPLAQCKRGAELPHMSTTDGSKTHCTLWHLSSTIECEPKLLTNVRSFSLVNFTPQLNVILETSKSLSTQFHKQANVLYVPLKTDSLFISLGFSIFLFVECITLFTRIFLALSLQSVGQPGWVTLKTESSQPPFLQPIIGSRRSSKGTFGSRPNYHLINWLK